MKQSGRVVLLTVLSVCTLGVFALLWTTRPDVHNEMIEVARKRQMLPLFEVEKPARLERTEAQERQKEADELYPYIQQKMLADQAVSDTLVSQLNAEIDARVEAAISARLNDAVEASLASYKEEVASQLAALKSWTEEEIQARLESYVPQAVESLIPRIMPVVVAEFEANKQEYIARLANDLGPSMEIVAEDMVESQRESIVTEAVGKALDEFERDLERGLHQIPSSGQQASEESPQKSIITAPNFEIHENPTLLDEDEYNSERDATRARLLQQVADVLEQ